MWKRVNAVLRYLFFLLVVRPIVLIVLGLNVRRESSCRRPAPPSWSPTTTVTSTRWS